MLRACDVLDPRVLFSTPLDDVKKKFKVLALNFENLIPKQDIPELLDQVASLHAKNQVRALATVWTPVQVFSRLMSWKDGKYALIGKLGCALLSIHNSSSMAERDFSIQVRLNFNFFQIFMQDIFRTIWLAIPGEMQTHHL